MRNVFAVLLIFLCTPALADDVADRTALAQRLSDLLEVRVQYEFMYRKCAQPDADLEKDLLELYSKHIDDFGGIAPHSAYWPEATKIYREYADRSCVVMAPDKVEPMIVRAYAQSMSAAQLRNALEFYSAPAGQALHAGGKKVTYELIEMAMGNLKDDDAAAALMFRQSLLILKRKYTADPK